MNAADRVLVSRCVWRSWWFVFLSTALWCVHGLYRPRGGVMISEGAAVVAVVGLGSLWAAEAVAAAKTKTTPILPVGMVEWGGGLWDWEEGQRR